MAQNRCLVYQPKPIVSDIHIIAVCLSFIFLCMNRMCTYNVRSYYNQIYKRYKGGDYYVFLKELPYAMDPKYISKLQTIQSQLK